MSKNFLPVFTRTSALRRLSRCMFRNPQCAVSEASLRNSVHSSSILSDTFV
jgi:hypothetical protein